MGLKRFAAVVALGLLPWPVSIAQPVIACDGLNCTVSQPDMERLLNLIDAHREALQAMQEELRRCQA